MIIYFADRQLNILGHASTKLPEGLKISDDKKTEDIETGAAIFECTIPFDSNDRNFVQACTEVGNYLLRSFDGENEFYTIIESEIDTKKQTVYIYAEDAGMDLLNEVFGEYEADKAYPITHYIDKFAAGSGFTIGINEAKNLTRKLSWDSESTAAARIASVATQFDGCEISYSFDIDNLMVVKKYINIYKERGKDIGIPLRLNREIDNIVTSKSIANLATALQCNGGTPDDEEDPITLKGYSYDDGDFYVDGNGVLKSRKALKQWARFLWKDDDSSESGGHIVKQYSYDTTSQKTLCSHAITELKKIRDVEVNYEADITNFPENVKVGDRVNIVDDAGELYLSTRVLILERSETNQTQKAVFGEYLIKGSGISQKVADLAEQFAKNSQSAARALGIAVNANIMASEAKEQVDDAVKSVEEAQKAVEDVAEVVETARQSAAAAQEAANNAQSVVDGVEGRIESLESSLSNAELAAQQAQQAAQTAETKVVEAQRAAENAQINAEDAKESALSAQEKADQALQLSTEAQSDASDAISKATAAENTANAAKLDAEQAQEDIDNLGNSLTTLSNTMTAEYARKTDLTEAEASLQSQINQNAAGIETTVTRIQEIDETANNAAEQAQAAQTAAQAAQTTADQAKANATSAQTKADEAALAAANAQTEADKAKAAAETAQSVADQAEADLETAKADLATVQGRIDATEDEIAEAQSKVDAAQLVVNQAKADAEAAVSAAETAQAKANEATTNANNAQTVANNAAAQANLAQQVADQAKGDATAAVNTAQEAANTAAEAQRTAANAVTNAQNAQNAADNAAQLASDAQAVADQASEDLETAKADLKAAQDNLTAVTNRVDATEDEVEAAQAAVTRAQQAAETAQNKATTAQNAADQAKTDALNAQTAADNAKKAADDAQAAADAAQDAADNAQQAVDNLAITVTEQGTLISQKADTVTLNAYKNEMRTTLGGYYTKTETDSKIQIESNSIKQTVSAEITEKVNAVEIGGRNLYTGTADFSGDKWVNIAEYTADGTDGFGNVVLTKTNAWLGLFQERQAKAGEVYTLSVNARGDGVAKLWFYASEVLADGTENTHGVKDFGVCPTTETRFNESWEVRNDCTLRFRVENSIAGQRLWVSSLKLEKGNKATDWTPAPEDMASTDLVETTRSDISSSLSDVAADIDNVAAEVGANKDAINETLLIVEENSEQISSLIQEASGFTMEFTTINETVKQLNDKLETEVDERYSYIRFIDGKIWLGKEAEPGEDDFKVSISNQRMSFWQNGVEVAYMSNNRLYISDAHITGSLNIGPEAKHFRWETRNGGRNLGIRPI